MLWLLLAFGTALMEGALVVERKRLLNAGTPFELAYTQSLLGVVFFSPLLILVWKSDVVMYVWVLIGARSVLDALGTLLLFTALERDDASRVMPITALTPLFMVIIEFGMTGRIPTWLGLIGIVLIVFGAFLLMLGAKKETGMHFTPGMVPIFLTTLLWSFTSVIHTVVTRETGALFYLGMSSLGMFFFLILFGFLWRKTTLHQLLRVPIRRNASIGLLSVTMQALQMFAQSLAPLASYVLALKRTSLFFGMMGSKYILGEQIKQRVVPTFLLVLGAVCVLIS
jgi:drug/metabolite transporter (DMT)-like permease